ncbi:uncharacterized protein [Temnothorax nylanderi]|uniref:uncharacterized protein n=1 Tax=Temnothorax nylanderi TaxID=102681 RepID=UPI003A85A7C2
MEPRRTQDNYYDICRRYLELVGQWPYQKSKQSVFFLILILFFDVNVLFTQAARFFVCDNMKCIFETLPPHILAAIIPVKIFTYQFNIRKIKHLTDRLFVDWDMLETKTERDIMRKYAENGRWYVLIYSSYVYISTISFTTTSLVPRILDVVFPLNTSRPIILAYPAYYFVDENRYFYYIFLHMIICATACLTGLIAHDCMFFTYIEHTCGLFAVVKYRFEHVSHKRSNAEKSTIDCSNSLYYKNIVISIQAHRKALQFVKILEDTFSISLAVQLLLITLCLSITLVQLSMQLHESAEAMRYFVFIMAQLFHLFCFSFQGQKLINHSLETRDNIYHSLWYKIPVKEQRLLLFVMRKSLEASVFTAGKIYVFSLENFTTIKDLIDRLDSDWKKLEGADEQDIMKTYAANARLFSLAYCLYYYIVAGAFVSISLIPHVLNAILPLNESQPIFMPYEAYYFVDGEKYFFYIFFHALVGVEIGITAVIAHDCMLLICIQHICSVFAVAGFRFGILSRTDRNDAINNDVYDQKFAVSVYAHWRALQFAQLLEKTFCVSFAVQIMIVTVAMSISLLQIALQLNEIPEMMRYTAFVISQVIHLFCISLQGQRLIDHSVQIRDQIYNSSWYEIPAKWQRLLLYVMRKSMQPNYLSAGKIYVFSLKSFTTVKIIYERYVVTTCSFKISLKNAVIFKVIQSSVSYFTVLASFQ